MLHLDAIPVLLEDLPEVARAGASHDAPPEKRLVLARALLPLPPEDLLTVLVFLTHDPAEAVASEALASLEKVPWGVITAALGQHAHRGVTDWFARNHPRKDDLHSLIVANRGTADVTITFIAAKGKGQVLEQIAANQMRMQRCPDIVEALYYNPDTRMGTVSTVLENAVRLGIDLSQIPGYREIVESIFGREGVARILGASAVEPEPAPAEPLLPPEAVPPPEVEPAVAEVAETDWDALLAQEGEEGLDEAAFAAVLQGAAEEQAEEAKEGEADGTGEADEQHSTSMFNQVAKMSIPQKVRMALLGSDQVRGILIRDNRRIIYLSVLKSPRVTDKEIAGYAKNKALNQEIIQTIAQNRDWTKLYSVKMSLVHNPKCPPIVALGFLRSLTPKDVKHISQSKDVPAYVARQAKQMLQTKEKSGRG